MALNLTKTSIEITATDNTAGAFNSVNTKMRGLSSEASNLTSNLKGFFAIGTFALFAQQAAASIDAYTKFNAQLKNATGSLEQFKQAQGNVADIAARAQVNIGALGSTYARLSNALKDSGISQQQVSNVVETLSLGLKANGASAEEASSALLQLSQSFGKGKLDGDEFRTAMEAAPNVMRALAKSIGVPFGELKNLSAQGKLTNEVMVKAFTDPNLLASMREQAKATQTIGGSLEVVKNNLMLLIGVMDGASGVSTWVKDSLGSLSEFLTKIKYTMENGTWYEKLMLIYRFTVSDRIKNQISGDLANGAPIDYKGLEQFRELTKLQEKAANLEKLPRNGSFQNGFQTSTFGAELAAARHKINELKQTLGMATTGSLTPYPNGEIIKPNLGARFDKLGNLIPMRDEGQGGADERQNQDINKPKVNLESLARQREALAKHQLDNQNKFYAIGKDMDDQLAKREQEHMKLYDKNEKHKLEVQEKYYLVGKKMDDEVGKYEIDHIKKVEKIHEDSIKKLAEEQQRMAENISKSLQDTLANAILNGGKLGAKDLKAFFKNVVLQPIINGILSPFTQKIGATLAAAFSPSAFAGTGGGSGIGGLVSSVKDIFSGGNNLITSGIQNIGSLIANGNGGILDSIGGFISQNSTALASGFSYLGAGLQLLKGNFASAALTAVGTYFGGPIGGAIGSLVGGLFGGGHKKTKGDYTYGSYANDKFNTYLRHDEGGGSLGALSALETLNQTFSQQLSQVLLAFGAKDTINTYSGVKANKKGNFGYFSAQLNGRTVGDAVSSYTNYGGADPLQAIVSKAFGSTFVQALQASSITSSIKKYFNGLTDATAISNAVTAILTLKTSLSDLPPVFDSVRRAFQSSTDKTTLDQLQANFSAIGTYTSLFYSQQEQFDTFTKQITSRFTNLNAKLPETRDGFRALVDGLNTTTAAGLAEFNALVALAPTMDNYYKALQQQNGALAIATALTQDSFATLVDYNRFQAVSQNYDAGFAANYTSNLSSGAINVGANGTAKVSSTGSNDIVGALKNLQKAIEALAIYSMQSTNILKKFDGNGMPEVRTLT